MPQTDTTTNGENKSEKPDCTETADIVFQKCSGKPAKSSADSVNYRRLGVVDRSNQPFYPFPYFTSIRSVQT